MLFSPRVVNQLTLLILLTGQKLVRRAIERELNGYTGALENEKELC